MLADQYQVIDCDSHVTEPPDLWTSRMADTWGDLVPHVKPDDRHGFDRWHIGETKLGGVAASAQAGWTEYAPSYPPTLELADAGSWNPDERLRRLDEYGVYGQVLYPNILGFSLYAVLAVPGRDYRLSVVQAYNDFLTDFASVDPKRLLPIMCIPFWDVEGAVAEIRRAYSRGHKGILFASSFERVGLPPLTDGHWDPIYATAQELGLSINFHIGFSDLLTEEDMRKTVSKKNTSAEFARNSALMLLGNARAIAEVVTSDVCQRFPELNFVSVESGAGWLPFLLESLDWQWKGSGAFKEYSDRLLPSEYFRRQVYGSFWFEGESVRRILDLVADNMMFETDFPHPTSLSPGPASPAILARDLIEEQLGSFSPEIAQKVLHDTAARIYQAA